MFHKIVEVPKKMVRDFQKLPLVQQVVIGVVVALAVYWVWTNYSMRYREGFEDESASSSQPTRTLTCTMFFTEWCGYCKSAKPEWAKLVDMFDGRVVNGTKIVVTSVDCDKNPEIAKQNGVTGYPTFKFDMDGRALDFSGERNFDSFKQFVESAINGQ